MVAIRAVWDTAPGSRGDRPIPKSQDRPGWLRYALERHIERERDVDGRLFSV